MKTFIIIILFISIHVFSQNITNTLGSGGVFTIKISTTTYFTLTQSTGYVDILRSLNLSNTIDSNSGVIRKGGVRFMHNYGALNSDNTFLGLNSGNFYSTGLYNTGIGYSTLYSNTSGQKNSAIGSFSLYSNTTGLDNTGLGYYSLYTNTLGNYNTGIGSSSLKNNLGGSNNTAVGVGSMFSNSSGTLNTALGYQSLYTNTTGANNTAIGYQSLYTNNGSKNTALGYQSLYSNNAGANNTAVGYLSLYKNSGGSNNSALGNEALYNTVSGNDNTALGYFTLRNATGNQNTAIGNNSGTTVTSGSNLTLIGEDSEPSSPTSSNQITLGNGFITALRSNVTTITSLSDARDKKNISDLKLGLDFIAKLKPRMFNWDKREWYDNNIPDGSKMQQAPTAGFIAQELDELQISENAEWLNLVLKDNPERLEATTGNLLPVMVKAIQELNIKVINLKNKQTLLLNELEDLKKKYNSLIQEASINNTALQGKAVSTGSGEIPEPKQ